MSMTETDIEIILDRAREKFPDATPRIISDNDPQFIAANFKSYIQLCGMTHVIISHPLCVNCSYPEVKWSSF